jgi:hypothetical protein
VGRIADFASDETVDREEDVERLERIRAVLYQFLVPGTGNLDALELRPKTYTEAVKSYLEVDSRIDEKKGKGQSSGLNEWKEMILRCLSLPEPTGRAGERHKTQNIRHETRDARHETGERESEGASLQSPVSSLES